MRLDYIVCTLLASLRSNSGWQKWIELPGTCVLVVSCFLYVYLTYHWPCKVIWGHLIISPVTFNKIDWVLFSSLEQNSMRAFLVLSPASSVCPFVCLLFTFSNASKPLGHIQPNLEQSSMGDWLSIFFIAGTHPINFGSRWLGNNENWMGWVL